MSGSRKEEQHKRDKPDKGGDTGSPFGKPIVIPIEDSLDLHAFAPREIPSVVAEYLDQCREAEIFEVRLVHGRGKGVQRRIVRALLEKHSGVASFRDAPPESGGWGATLVVLKRVRGGSSNPGPG